MPGIQLLGGQDNLLLIHYPILADAVLFNAESFLYQVLEQHLLELKLFPFSIPSVNKFYSTSIAENPLVQTKFYLARSPGSSGD